MMKQPEGEKAPLPPSDWDSVRPGSAEGAVLLVWFVTIIVVAAAVAGSRLVY
jgi:hypothetical protein